MVVYNIIVFAKQYFKKWKKLTLPEFKEKMKEGKIKGTCYEGECCCFVGTIANIQGKSFDNITIKPNISSAVERWFLQFKEGDTPENSKAMKLTMDWIEELETLI